MTAQPADHIRAVLAVLAERLDPIIQGRLAPHLHGLEWTVVLTELDRAKGRQVKVYDRKDVQPQLRVLTERLGGLGYPFSDRDRQVEFLGTELRMIRNLYAHMGDFTPDDAYRAADTAHRLLTYFGDDEGVAAIDEVRQTTLAALATELLPEPAPPAPAQDDENPTAEAPLTEPAPAPSDGAGSGDEQNDGDEHGDGDDADAVDFDADSTGTEDADADDAAQEPDDVVTPDEDMQVRPDDESTPTIGQKRVEYEPWEVTHAGMPEELKALPKKAAKAKLWAVIEAIVEFEGPVHMDRVRWLVLKAFEVKRPSSKLKQQIVRQLENAGYKPDKRGFCWPKDLDRESWRAFRPNDSSVNRKFEEIPVEEIANAVQDVYTRYIDDMPDARELERKILSTFGRKRKSKSMVEQLNAAYALADSRGEV